MKMENLLQRLEALESAATHRQAGDAAGIRRLRAWQCAAAVLLAALFAGPLPGTAQGNQSQQGGLPALEKRVAALEQKLDDQAVLIAALQAALASETAAR